MDLTIMEQESIKADRLGALIFLIFTDKCALFEFYRISEWGRDPMGGG